MTDRNIAINNLILLNSQHKAKELSEQLMKNGFPASTIMPDYSNITFLIENSEKKIIKSKLGKLYRKITFAEKTMFIEYWKCVKASISTGLLSTDLHRFHYNKNT